MVSVISVKYRHGVQDRYFSWRNALHWGYTAALCRVTLELIVVRCCLHVAVAISLPINSSNINFPSDGLECHLDLLGKDPGTFT